MRARRCLPQGARTADELADFKRMLKEVNLLYLGTSVLILLDLSYLSRFWTQARCRQWSPRPFAPLTPRAWSFCSRTV